MNGFQMWNALAQTITRPLWERCMQLLCLAGGCASQVFTSKQGSSLPSIFDMFTSATSPAIIIMSARVPILINMYFRRRKCFPYMNELVSSFIAIMESSVPEVQGCIAYSLGLLARLWCNPGLWDLDHGVCPRPKYISGGVDSSFQYSVEKQKQISSRWDDFKSFWSLASNGNVALCAAARSEILRAYTAISRRALPSILESRADEFLQIMQMHWTLLLDARTSCLVRFTVATEAGVMLLGKGAQVRNKYI